MADQDLLAVKLAAIRERAEQITTEHDEGDCDLNGDTCTGHDAERLLAAVEALLAPHQPGCAVILGALCLYHAGHRFFSITSAEAADVAACPDCTATVYVSCAGCGTQVPLDSCPVRSAATTALLREDTAP